LIAPTGRGPPRRETGKSTFALQTAEAEDEQQAESAMSSIAVSGQVRPHHYYVRVGAIAS
tara:strand:+ start:16 stop:195 length:180 start_codon:yes stop_codon:yes gene_type:complete